MLAFCCILCFSGCGGSAQVLTSDRTVDWSGAGLRDSFPTYSHTIDFSLNGGKGDGTSINDAVWKSLLESLTGGGNIIYFPAGTYKFTNTLTLPDSIILRGAGAGSTKLLFSLGGAAKNCIDIDGQGISTEFLIQADAAKGSNTLNVPVAAALHAGDYIRLLQDDAALLASPWAYGCVGQIAKVTAVHDNVITIASPLRRGVVLADHPRVMRIIPRIGTGIECLSLERTDQTTEHMNTVSYVYAASNWIVGVESNKSNFAHVQIDFSTNIAIQGSYFHHAFQYGDGGQGYGIAIQSASGECLIENNCFNNLRHSVLFQSGANGNVIAYNYSVNPYWSDQTPSNMAGDLVLHGNYPFANLFEGNVCQTIMVDASHGINGPNNTFLRNRVELYGILMSPSPASDKQTYIANDVTNTTLPYGNYLLFGNGHYQSANRIRGTVTPSGTDTCTTKSLYTNRQPAFWNSFPSAWPTIGIPYHYGDGSNPARERFTQVNQTDCNKYNPALSAVDPIMQPNNPVISAYPNPIADVLLLRNEEKGSRFTIIDGLGRIMKSGPLPSPASISFSGLENGSYFVQIMNASELLSTLSVVHIK